MVKVASADIAEKIIWRAMHMHGSLGLSNEMPFAHMIFMAGMLGLADGPTEVHKVSVARRVLRRAKAHDGFFPPHHLPAAREAAMAHYGLTPEAVETRA